MEDRDAEYGSMPHLYTHGVGALFICSVDSNWRTVRDPNGIIAIDRYNRA
jgi:hypothetical protein